MATDEEVIRTLIEQWAEAVRTGDMSGVLADHAEDIVMYDVPPPYLGVRGIDAYRDTWPGFFAWQASGAVFEIESLELVAGEDVAFAYALLRCGTAEDFDKNPQTRLRLTIGLRKENGRWIVVHEHHSFPHENYEAAEEVRALHRHWYDATAAHDLDGLMEGIAEDVVSYEHEPPLQHVGREAVREVCARGLDVPEVTLDVPDLKVVAEGNLAVAWGLNHINATAPEGESVDSWSRATRVFERRKGRWQMIHQHLSVPMDRETGMARSDLQP